MLSLKLLFSSLLRFNTDLSSTKEASARFKLVVAKFSSSLFLMNCFCSTSTEWPHILADASTQFIRGPCAVELIMLMVQVSLCASAMNILFLTHLQANSLKRFQTPSPLPPQSPDRRSQLTSFHFLNFNQVVLFLNVTEFGRQCQLRRFLKV